MTAEIAIMNREAVALAADSAVTLSNMQGDPVKIYQSANKIFALSQHHPVGIMFYDSASIMGLPWETIVKVYRRQLGSRSFPVLQEYAEDFFAFVSKNAKSLPLAPYFVVENVGGFFREVVLQAIAEEVEKVTHGQPSGVLPAQLETIFGGVIGRYHSFLAAGTPGDGVDKKRDAQLRKEHAAEISALIDVHFEKAPLTRAARAQLADIGHFVMTRFFEDLEPDGRTGTVIAGFGDKEVLPSIARYVIAGITQTGFLKRRSEKLHQVSDASILPFAQVEMVRAFMEGIDPDYSRAVERLLTDVIRTLPENVLDLVPNMSPADRAAALAQLTASGKTMLKKTLADLESWRHDRYVSPVIQMVGGLPKDELAALAEALVNLTILKRRVSTDAETVGGPIDVAVISKGDGFVWIKRKHYFRPELNLQFTQRYHASGSTNAASGTIERGTTHGKRKGRGKKSAQRKGR